jgi:methionyl-tRNA formyltransferase
MKILIFGDTIGVPQLLRYLPEENLVGVVGASIRPQYNKELEELAVCRNIKFLIQPRSNSEDYELFVKSVRSLNPELIFVNSYSMIIRDDILSVPRLGALNIHTGLLPRNRGCNPTQWAILKNEFRTGVTLHEIDSGIDTGPIVDQREIPIFIDDTWLDIRDREYRAIDGFLKANLNEILSGTWKSHPQDNEIATTGYRRKPEDGEFIWSEKIIEIHNKIRALIPPLPPAFYLRKDRKKVEFDKYLTPWEITSLKYDPEVGGGSMTTDRINLRPLRKSDSHLLYQWITDRDLVRFNSAYFPVSESDHGAWIEKMMRKHSDLVIFVVEENEEKNAIGTCQLFNINWVHRNAELKIRIGDKEYLGKGYGSEAVSMLTRFGFNDLNLHRIYLQVFASNQRAVNAYKKCGFKQEGVARESAFINGYWENIITMGILEDG